MAVADQQVRIEEPQEMTQRSPCTSDAAVRGRRDVARTNAGTVGGLLYIPSIGRVHRSTDLPVEDYPD